MVEQKQAACSPCQPDPGFNEGRIALEENPAGFCQAPERGSRREIPQVAPLADTGEYEGVALTVEEGHLYWKGLRGETRNAKA